jgi:hypothetical protein
MSTMNSGDWTVKERRPIYATSAPDEPRGGQSPDRERIIVMEPEAQVVAGVYVTRSSRDSAADDPQSWYWSAGWQRAEREAEEDLRAGRYKDFSSMSDLLDDLMADE